MGLALSANSRNLQEAGAGLMRLILLSGILWLALWGAAYFLGLEMMERYVSLWRLKPYRCICFLWPVWSS